MASERRHGRNRPRRDVPAGRYNRVNEAPSLLPPCGLLRLISSCPAAKKAVVILRHPVILYEVPTAYFQAEAENRMSNQREFR
jgi:hypothetical protein